MPLTVHLDGNFYLFGWQLFQHGKYQWLWLSLVILVFSFQVKNVCCRTKTREITITLVGYVGTTDILCSTFSFESVKFFSHFYRPPPQPPPHPWHLSYVYDIVTFKFECQGWGGGWGGGMWHKHPPTPSNFLLRCCPVKFFLGDSVLCKVSEYISYFVFWWPIVTQFEFLWFLGLNT